MIEFKESVRSFATEPEIQADEHAFCRVESKPKTIGCFKFAQFDVVHTREDIAGIAEDRHIQTGKCFPPVFEVEHNGLIVSKPEFPEPSKVLRAAKNRK